MRQLKPEVVEQRKRNLLQWVIHYYIKNSKPVSSAAIAQEAGLDLSSATIRNVLQELEEEGYLAQPHTSSGREPTDKGYRFYVDYLVDLQRGVSEEKEKLESQYHNRVEELDTLLVETSKLLSRVSHGAGLVLSPQPKAHALKRLELIHLDGRNVLGILVTEAGMIRHWPIKLGFTPTSRQINVLNRFLNETVKGCSVQEAQTAVMAKLRQMESEFRELNLLAGELLKEVAQVVTPEALFIEGADQLIAQAQDIGDLGQVQALMRLIGEKRRLAGLLEGQLAKPSPGPTVRIGAESGIKELEGVSLVTHVYRHQGQVLGVLGILGSKRMEYDKMMSLVDTVSGIVTSRLIDWQEKDLG